MAGKPQFQEPWQKDRADHQDFKDYVYSATDVEKAKQTCNETLRMLNMDRYEKIKRSPYFWLKKMADSTVKGTVEMVERYFQW